MENAYAVSRFLLSGSGGQGVITMAILLAEAAVKYEGLVAVQSQSYGPEARGGATRSDVILSHKAIYYPKVEQPNILVALTDAACVKYLPLIRPGGLCIYDTELVHPGRKVEAQFKGLPLWGAVRERLGSAVSYNVAVLGALVTLTGAVRIGSIEMVLAERFPAAHPPLPHGPGGWKGHLPAQRGGGIRRFSAGRGRGGQDSPYVQGKAMAEQGSPYHNRGHFHAYPRISGKKALKRIRGTHAGGTACRHTRRSGAGRTGSARPGVGGQSADPCRGQGQGWRREGVPQPGRGP